MENHKSIYQFIFDDCYSINMKPLPIVLLLIGGLLLTYGILAAPVANEVDIRRTYACDRTTKEIRGTDKYCSAPASAPEARRDYSNPYVLSGLAVSLIGGVYTATQSRVRK
jgi:hypothetical protein